MTNEKHTCPSSECRDQFFLLKHVGIICKIKVDELLGDPPSVLRLLDVVRDAEERTKEIE